MSSVTRAKSNLINSCAFQKVKSLIGDTRLTSTLSPYKLSLWFSLLKTWAGYLFLALQAMSSASMSIILSSGIPSRLTVLEDKGLESFLSMITAQDGSPQKIIIIKEKKR